MSEIVRFSVSLEDDLLAQFDRFCTEQHFATRSEAVRQLIRDKLTAHAWASDAQDVAGTLTLVYDHHRPQLRDHLTALQHDHMEMVVSTLHAAFDPRSLPGGDRLARPRRQATADRLAASGAQRDLEGRTGDGGGQVGQIYEWITPRPRTSRESRPTPPRECFAASRARRRSGRPDPHRRHPGSVRPGARPTIVAVARKARCLRPAIPIVRSLPAAWQCWARPGHPGRQRHKFRVPGSGERCPPTARAVSAAHHSCCSGR